MGNVFEIKRRRLFSLEEATGLLPVIKKITEESSQKVHKLTARFEAVKNTHAESAMVLEKEIHKTVQTWQAKLEKLGVQTKGLWIADFDSGDGYFCWKFPEDRITHWHRYSDGFRNRVRLEEREQVLARI